MVLLVMVLVALVVVVVVLKVTYDMYGRVTATDPVVQNTVH